MIWSAISYNWSLGRPTFNVFAGPHSHEEAKRYFKDNFPGENLLALIQGDHTMRHSLYNLEYPLPD
jgi:hypothetical protein